MEKTVINIIKYLNNIITRGEGMKIFKMIIMYLVNILIGYASAIYLLLAVSGIQNTTKGVPDPDLEDMRWVGVVMLIVWFFFIWFVNVVLGKLLRENMREKLRIFHEKKFLWKNVLFTYLPMAICVAIGIEVRFYVLDSELFKADMLKYFSLFL